MTASHPAIRFRPRLAGSTWSSRPEPGSEAPDQCLRTRAVRALHRVGFVFNRQKGSHMVLRRENPRARVVVPDHKQIRPATLRRILNQAGLTVEQLHELL
ncbi:MAG: type II toxin-antitoxin system HicA family toxin [Acidobacteria bacterium]|nr:type II toxin-antitoxin system HicA family toxin [Acidobacteriota bacterium]